MDEGFDSAISGEYRFCGDSFIMTACSVVVPSTIMRGTCVVRTATGTIRITGTTIQDSGWWCPLHPPLNLWNSESRELGCHAETGVLPVEASLDSSVASEQGFGNASPEQYTGRCVMLKPVVFRLKHLFSFRPEVYL